mgnify:CR=1 FL=1
MTYLTYVSLQTGTVERVAPPDRAATHPAALDLARALRDGAAPVSTRPGYSIKASLAGPALLCTVFRGELMPLVTFGAVARSRGSEKLWRMMHDLSSGYGLATDPEDSPPPPWCAVRVEPSLAADPDEPWRWLPAYEVELATAWIERRHLDA